MRKLLIKIKQWYTGFVDVKMSSPVDEDFSISIKPVPASRVKRFVDRSWKFWKRNWANVVLIILGVLTLIATLYPSMFPKKHPSIQTEHKAVNSDKQKK